MDRRIHRALSSVQPHVTPAETVCLSYLLYLCYLCLQAIYLQAHSANTQYLKARASLRTLTAIKH